MHVTVITPPDPVVTWEEAKAHLKLDDDEQQDYVEGLAAAALAWIGGPGGWLGRAVGLQTLEVRFQGFGCNEVVLPMGPVAEVDSIGYLDPDRAELTFADYTVLSDGRIRLDAGSSWPALADDPEAVRIQYQAGEEEVPPAIKQAMLLLIAHWFKNRETVNVGNIVNTMPLAADALLSTYRRWG